MSDYGIALIIAFVIFVIAAIVFVAQAERNKKIATESMKIWDANFPQEISKLQISPTSTIVVESATVYSDPNKQEKRVPHFVFCLDTNAKKFAFVKFLDPLMKGKCRVESNGFEFESIASCSLLEGGRQIDSTTLGSGVGAYGGGLSTGAGVASTTSDTYLSSLQIVIQFKDVNAPIYTIDMFKGKAKETSNIMKEWKKQALQINTIINKIIEENQ